MTTRVAIFGAAGDLTSRYLMPALALLEESGLVADDLDIVAVDRKDWTTEDFRSHVEDRVDARVEVINALCGRLRYARADVTSPDEVAAALGDVAGSLVVYLALPPGLLPDAVVALARASLPDGSLVVIEKPFGTDLESARGLNELLHQTFREDQIFRIDHFVHKQMVQNILGLRFANRLFEPVWNCNNIERVDIVWDESVALEGRSSYYDTAGALRDMIQNHLLQLLCLIAMEPPASVGERDLRDAKATVLRSIPTLTEDEVRAQTVRARYTKGQIDGKAIPAYVDEDGVDASRNTETLAEIILEVKNWRWSGTKFRLRSGKALAHDRAEVAVYFRPVPHLAFGPDAGSQPNVFRISFSPDRLVLSIDINGPGDPFELEQVELDVDLHEHGLPAYARLLLEVLERDPTLSVRADEAEESWRILEPVLEAWEKDVVPLLEYPAGSDGPEK